MLPGMRPGKGGDDDEGDQSGEQCNGDDGEAMDKEERRKKEENFLRADTSSICTLTLTPHSKFRAIIQLAIVQPYLQSQHQESSHLYRATPRPQHRIYSCLFVGSIYEGRHIRGLGQISKSTTRCRDTDETTLTTPDSPESYHRKRRFLELSITSPPGIADFDGAAGVAILGGSTKERIGKVLRDQKDWRRWISEVQTIAEINLVWKYMDPELETQPDLPIRRTDIKAPDDMKKVDGTIRDPITFDKYQEDEWKRYSNSCGRLFQAIRNSIDPDLDDVIWKYQKT